MKPLHTVFLILSFLAMVLFFFMTVEELPVGDWRLEDLGNVVFGGLLIVACAIIAAGCLAGAGSSSKPEVNHHGAAPPFGSPGIPGNGAAGPGRPHHHAPHRVQQPGGRF